jgi:hypothetical protein
MFQNQVFLHQEELGFSPNQKYEPMTFSKEK